MPRARTRASTRSAVPPAAIAARSDLWRNVLICVGLTLATFAVFAQTWNFGFINYDDPQYIVQNPIIERGLSLQNIIWSFTTFEFFNWHPLTWISYFIDYEIYGLNAGGFHITNVLLHAANAVLLYFVLNAMTRSPWPSAFVAALFAIHPLHVESVAWISERKDVLSTLFCFLALLAYARFAAAPNLARYMLVVMWFALSLMAKPMYVTLPAVLLLLDIWPLQRIKLFETDRFRLQWSSIWPLLAEKLPLLMLSIASSVVTVLAQGEAIRSTDRVPLLSRVANATMSYAQYVRQTIWPTDLSIVYPYPVTISWGFVGLCTFVLLFITVVAIATVRKRPYLLVGWLWFLGTLVPVIGFVQVGEQARADRYTYFPLIGVFIMIAWSIQLLRDSARLLITSIAALVLFVLGVVAHIQTSHWRDSQSVFMHAVNAVPNNVTAHLQLGLAYMELGDKTRAEQQYNRAFDISPESPLVLSDLGSFLVDQGKHEESLPRFLEAIRRRPDFPQAYYNMGIALAGLERFDEAIAAYRKTIELRPNYSGAHFNLAQLLRRRGETDAAATHFREVLRIDPSWAGAHYSLGLILAGQNQLEDAANHFTQALQSNADHHLARFSLANALVGLGRLDDAAAQYEQLLRAQPDFADARNNYGAVLARQGKAVQAIEQYRAALQLRPQYLDALHNLGDALAAINQLDEAADAFAQAIALKPDSPVLHNNLGKVLLKHGQIEPAIEHFTEAVRLNPDFAEANQNLADALQLRTSGPANNP